MQLQYEFLVSMHREIILECPFFNNFDISFVVRVVPMLKPVLFQRGEYVWKSGDYSTMVLFLVSGTASFIIEPVKTVDQAKEGASSTGGIKSKKPSTKFFKKEGKGKSGNNGKKEKETLREFYEGEGKGQGLLYK